MNRIFINGDEQHVAAYELFVKSDSNAGYVYKDAEFTETVDKDELQRIFTVGGLIVRPDDDETILDRTVKFVSDGSYAKVKGASESTLYYSEEYEPTVVVAADTSVSLFGKAASALQSNIVVSEVNHTITGTLNYVTGYTGFSSATADQSGNYIALKVTTTNALAAETVVESVELIGGKVGHPIELDSDHNIVLKIANKDTQKIRVVVKHGAKKIERTYSLAGLTLATE